MIVYRLQCSRGHAFDEWFASMAEYQDKVGNGGVPCPECGDTRVGKAIMAPRIGHGESPAPAPCASCGEAGGCPWAGAGD